MAGPVEFKLGSLTGCVMLEDRLFAVETVAEARSAILQYAVDALGHHGHSPEKRDYLRVNMPAGGPTWDDLIECEEGRRYYPADPGMTCSYYLYGQGGLEGVSGVMWTYSVIIWATAPTEVSDHPARPPPRRSGQRRQPRQRCKGRFRLPPTSADSESTMSLTEEPVTPREPDPAEEETLEDLARQPRAWMIRAGVQGAFAESFIEAGIAAIGFGQLRDLSEVSGRDEIVELRGRESPELSEAQVRDGAGQLWAFLSGIRLGDLVAMPRGGSSQFALGTVTQEYWYRHDSDSMRHAVSVDWKRTEVPRTALRSDLLKSLSRPRTVNRITTEDHVRRLRQLMETGMDPGPRLDLAELVVQFRRETGYPTEDHERQKRLREEWAEKLAPGNVAHLSREDLAAYTRPSVDYGEYVNPTGTMLQWILDLDDDEYDRLRESIRDLCWGKDELSARIDRLVDWEGSRRDTGTKRFAQGNVNATLAICHPQRFLPVFFQGGKTGREQMLRTLNLPEPYGSTFGQQVVDANDRLREHLAPYLDDDPQAMAGFLYWLLDSDDVKEPVALSMDLTELAHKLLVDDECLQDIVSLLEDKGQVILYGPPGTGKTYLARALAEVLAPEESCRGLVQFHPSTSYEDFFEGYRPAKSSADGGIRYELTLGPLARMAKQASEAPDQQHVMIIDEINRGNLPRVLGELLFLLEYRDESVYPLYRPDEPFSLPENLWFIGTMNTADRSIALVDTALRRRFHFVPFFPDREPMAGLLGRWLERHGEARWVGHLVDAVNDELKEALEGSHLLLGPSHFMREYGSSLDTQRERLRRIWKYNIEPFVEDQFFGDPEQIDRFRFTEVMIRHGPLADAGSAVPAGSDEPTDGDRAPDPNESQDVDSQLWRSRAEVFPPPEFGDVSDSYRRQLKSVASRWVDYCTQRNRPPGTADEALIEDFLDSLGVADSSRRDYRSNLNKWFEHNHDTVVGGDR